MSDTKPVFASETMPVETISYHEAQKLLAVGEPDVPMMMHPNGLIQYERGAAVVGITPFGEMVMLSTTDIADLELEHHFVRSENFRSPDKPHERFAVSEADLKVPVNDRIIGKDILKDGSYYLGQFIRRREFKNGDNNYNHLLGVAAWAPTPKRLIQDILRAYAKGHAKDLRSSGILLQHSALNWTSREMVFVAKPMTEPSSGAQKKNDKGEDLFSLVSLTAPGKGMDAAKLYYSLFSKDEEGNITIGGRLKRPFVSSLLVHEENMTLPQIQKAIEERFSPTAKLLRQGESPYRHNLVNGEMIPKTGEDAMQGLLKNVWAYAVFGLAGITRLEVGAGVALPTAIYTAGQVMHAGTFSWPVVLGTPPILLAARFAWLWQTRTRQHFEEEGLEFENLIHHFWPEGVEKKNIPYQYEKADPDVIAHLRVPDRREINTLERVPAGYVQDAIAWDIPYTIDPTNGPYGTRLNLCRIGNQYVGLAKEDESTSGMTIEYWPKLEIAFAHSASNELLPDTIIENFRSAGKPIEMACVMRDEDGLLLGYRSEFLTQEEYDAKKDELARMTDRPIHRPEDRTAHFLRRHYKKGRVRPAEHDKEKKSEWAEDSKAVTAGEATVEVIKVALSRGGGPGH